jgi:hypothetical protein
MLCCLRGWSWTKVKVCDDSGTEVGWAVGIIEQRHMAIVLISPFEAVHSFSMYVLRDS